jgi:hypothetical protein
MNSQLSKTARFICGGGGRSVSAMIRDLLFRTQNLNIGPLSPKLVVGSAMSVCRRRNRLGRSSLVLDGLAYHMRRTYRRCAHSRGTGRPSIFRRRDSTS